MANSNIINVVFGSGLCAVTTSAFRANYGMKLRFSGIELPTAFEVDFSNYDVAGHDSITAIGQNNEVQIPDQLWDSGLNIYAYVYLHPTDDSGVTVYTVTIPVLGRPNRTEEEPTPHEQSVIEQAISALNSAVEQTAADVVAADASASAAAQSEANAATSERSAAASAGAALASQNAAESASQSATESATNASESARNAANSASQAAESATAAQESAEQAEQSAQSIEGDVERAERAAATATDKATEAASSASTASGKANEASASATAAANSATAAASSAQNAASSAQSAESSATDANAAKTDAQDAKEAAETAQAAAEQAAQSVSGLSEQIVQNTADIADLVQSKAGVLVDTATGSIASFVPDATVPTVKGLTVDVEPVQDLHGYDAPWPAGGGKNLYNANAIRLTFHNGITATISDGQISLSGTATENAYFSTMNMALPSGSYVLSANNTSANSDVHVAFRNANGDYHGDNPLSTDNRIVYVQNKDINVVTFYVKRGATISNFIIKPQLETGTTATSYAPYSNICPISGWDSVEVKHSGADRTNPTTYQIQLGQTVYGCKLNVTQGKMVVDRAICTENDFTNVQSGLSAGGLHWADFPTTNVTTEGTSLCSILGKRADGGAGWASTTPCYALTEGVRLRIYCAESTLSEFRTAYAGLQIVYKLATPITIDLTPIEVAVLTGQTNNIWADSGNVSVEYAADLKTYIDQKIAAAVAALS